jgi:hypothetical protein
MKRARPSFRECVRNALPIRFCRPFISAYQLADQPWSSRESSSKSRNLSRNLTAEQQSYLRGKQFELEKNGSGRPEKGRNNYVLKTSKRLATQHNVDRRTIDNDARFARAVDSICDIVSTTYKNFSVDKRLPNYSLFREIQGSSRGLGLVSFGGQHMARRSNHLRDLQLCTICRWRRRIDA